MLEKLFESKSFILVIGFILGWSLALISFNSGRSKAEDMEQIIIDCRGENGWQQILAQAKLKESVEPILTALGECKALKQ